MLTWASRWRPGAIKTLRTNVVGSGLVPTPQVDADYLHLTEEQADHLQAEISREFSLWADSAACDASGMDNFWRLQTLAFTSFLMNGDVFAAVQFKERGNWPYALQLRLIEADQVCSPDRTDRMNPCKVDGINVHQIVQGVETDKDGAVIAYWVASRHPLAYDNPLPLTWTRVEARDQRNGRTEHPVCHPEGTCRAAARRSPAGTGTAHDEADGQIYGCRVGRGHRGIIYHAVYQA